MECPRMEPHRIRPPAGDLGGSGGGQRALSSGDTNQARIPSSPSALGDLGSHTVSILALSPGNGEGLSPSHPCAPKRERMEEALAVVSVGRDTPVQAVGGSHPHPTAFPEALCTQADLDRPVPLLLPLPGLLFFPSFQSARTGCHPLGLASIILRKGTEASWGWGGVSP